MVEQVERLGDELDSPGTGSKRLGQTNVHLPQVVAPRRVARDAGGPVGLIAIPIAIVARGDVVRQRAARRQDRREPNAEAQVYVRAGSQAVPCVARAGTPVGTVV